MFYNFAFSFQMSFNCPEFDPVTFVPATSEISAPDRAACLEGKPPQTVAEDGQTIQAFYESVVGSDTQHTGVGTSASTTCNKQYKCQKRKGSKSKLVHESDSTVKSSVASSATTGHSVLKFLKLAQSGDISELEKQIDSGADLDCRDQYGWTALMCAAEAGHRDTVILLLAQGANKDLKEARNLRAIDIAAKNKQQQVVEALENWPLFVGADTTSESCSKEEFSCEVCNQYFTDTSRSEHETSTLHLFNLKLPVPSTSYLLPETNRGYQILLRSGWDDSQGLGPAGSGRKFPVKTVLKQDRQGLGNPTQQAKVTHFAPNDTDSVKTQNIDKTRHRQMKISTISKKAHKRRCKQQKEKERNFRREFYTE